jgi:periplasmic divalent cation tolerance protein
MKKESLVLIYVVYPKKFNLKGHISSLLKKNIIVCANVISGMSSHYRWKGKIEESKESVVIYKALSSLKKTVTAAIKKTHPYEVPFIAVIKAESVNAEYLNYAIEQQTK